MIRIMGIYEDLIETLAHRLRREASKQARESGTNLPVTSVKIYFEKAQNLLDSIKVEGVGVGTILKCLCVKDKGDFNDQI